MEDKENRIGPFPSWKSLYFAVVAYTAALILLLYLLTLFFDHSSQ